LLPLPQRLASHYARGAARGATLALLAFDVRLSELVAKANEPLLAQLRLAWWRDELGKPEADRARGDPVLDAIGKTWAGEEAALTALVDGWEQLIGEPPLSGDVLEQFFDSRAAAFAALARLMGQGHAEQTARTAGKIWAIADFLARSTDAEERATAMRLSAPLTDRARARLPRELRAVAVLRGLGLRAILRGDGALVSGRRDVLAAVRLGMLGR